MKTPGLNPDRAAAFLRGGLPAAVAPFTFELVAAGGSNLTYRVADANGQHWALRRPPDVAGVPTAHDMRREFIILTALHTHGSTPVPEPVVYCDDVDVIGAPFYVMDFVDGTILRDRADGQQLTPDQARRASESLVETQVGFHTVDLDEVRLAELGRHHGYVERQLKRWDGQIARFAAHECRDLRLLHRRLAACVPPERVPAGLAHGDYRFDNTVLAHDHTIAAVLDWELCTTGNPIADFVWSLQYWGEADDDITFLPDPPTACAGFPDRAWVVEHYAKTSGFDLSDLDYYTVFSWWKQACIVEGVYARRQRGSKGGSTSGGQAAIADRAAALTARALRLADELL